MYSADSFNLRGDVRNNHFLGILLKCRQAPGLTIYAQLQPRPRPWHLPQDEYWLVVKTSLGIPLGPISIPVAFGPYQKWTEGRARLIFMFKETVEVALPSLASNVETREESTIYLQRCDLFLAS